MVLGWVPVPVPVRQEVLRRSIQVVGGSWDGDDGPESIWVDETRAVP